VSVPAISGLGTQAPEQRIYQVGLESNDYAVMVLDISGYGVRKQRFWLVLASKGLGTQIPEQRIYRVGLADS
jgi:hypothetical protein